MKGLEMDRYCRRSTLFQFDPRFKLAATLSLVVAISFLRDLNALLLAAIFVIALAIVSRLPAKFLLRAYALTIPFIIFGALAAFLTAGWVQGVGMAVRISVSVVLLLLLVSTTQFFELLGALRWFKVPMVLCSLLLFTYRYLFVLVDEMDRMGMARRARGFTGRGNLLSKNVFQTISFTVGMVLVRSYQRARKIYEALMSRGYDGEIRTLRSMRARARDAAFLVSFISVAAITLAIQVGAIEWTPLG